MKTKIKILIIEDQRLVLLDYKYALMKNPDVDIEILPASTVEKARELYKQNQDDLNIIVMDAELGNGTKETTELTKELRKTFKGPVIANSSLNSCNDSLIEAGCTHRSKSKNSCPEKIFEIINKFQEPLNILLINFF